MSKKVLVIGATGAMGRHLVPELVKLGYSVTGISLDEQKKPIPGVTYHVGDCFDKEFLSEILKNKFDGIVNFMYFGAKRPWQEYMDLFLQNTDHYIFLSSCRVYADEEVPVKETSPRLWDVSKDEQLLKSTDYCIMKAQCEDMLWNSSYDNFTIVRPATTFSEMRYQLVTWEAQYTVGRAHKGKKIIVPKEAYDKPATLCWGGDVAKMIARLMFKPQAMREAYNVCSSESRTWGEIAQYYKDICGLESVWVDKEDYLRVKDPALKTSTRWQLEYARLFRRITDNSKMLAVTGLKQSDFMPLYDALKMMIAAVPEGYEFPDTETDQRIDAYLEEHGL